MVTGCYYMCVCVYELDIDIKYKCMLSVKGMNNKRIMSITTKMRTKLLILTLFVWKL